MHLLWGWQCSPTYANGSSERTGCFWLPPVSIRTTRWWTRQPSQQIYAVVEVSDLFVGGPVTHKFNGGYIHLWVWSWQTLLAALSNEPLCLLPFLLSSEQEHVVEDDGPMRPVYIPSGVFIQKQFGIEMPFHLSNWQPSFPWPLPGGLGLIQFVPIVLF